MIQTNSQTCMYIILTINFNMYLYSNVKYLGKNLDLQVLNIKLQFKVNI